MKIMLKLQFLICKKYSEHVSTVKNQRVKKREGKTQIFGFWAGQSGQIFLAGYIWAVKSSHRWQHLWAKVKVSNLL